MKAFPWVVLALVAVPALAGEEAPSYSVSSGTLTYRLVHKFHEITATSKKSEGRARVLPDGRVQVMVRARVDSFDSGNGNRDAHMQETVDAARNPTVEVKAVAAGFTPPARFPAKQTLKLNGVTTLHGVEQKVAVDVELEMPDPAHVRARAKFPVSLEGFKIERPSLMFVAVDDKLDIDVDLTFAREP